jgi:opacity protein-like surface antigen
MRRWLLGIAVVFVAAGVAAADEKAEAVVKKGIEAHGGAEALNKYKAGKFNMKGDLSVLGMDLEFTGNIIYSMPDRFRLEVNTEVMGMKMTINQTVKGDKTKSTIKLGDMVLPAGGEAEIEELKLGVVMQEAEQLTPLLDKKKFTIKSGGEEKVNDKKADVVVVTSVVLKKEFKLFFDQKSGLVVKTAHRGLGPGADGANVEVDEEVYHSEFKKVNGVQVATKWLVNHDGKKFMTLTVSDVELLEKVDDKEFAIDD